MKDTKNDEGVWYNGRFCPVWSSLHWNATTDFYRGGLKDLARSCKCDDSLSVVVKIDKEEDMAKIYRIRKLTPRECFRLMGVSDADVDKIRDAGISESQQYKMAGNSIVVDVLEAIFTQLFRVDADCLF